VTWDNLRVALYTPAVLTSLYVMKTYRYLLPENNRGLFPRLYTGLQHYVPQFALSSCPFLSPRLPENNNTHTIIAIGLEYSVVGGGISCGPQLSRIAGLPLCSLAKCIACKITSFLGLFAELRRATTRFVMSVRLSAWNSSYSHCTDIHGISNLE
jgi:hypothetical protein